MRFAHFPRLRSLATQLLCTYTAALLLTTCTIVGILLFNSRQVSEGQPGDALHKMADLVRVRLHFDSAGVPRSDIPLSIDWYRIFRDFPADAKYRLLDGSGRVILSSDKEGTALTTPARPFDPTLDSFKSISDGETLLVRTERLIHGGQTYYLQVAISPRFMMFARAVAERIRFSDTLRLAFASMVLVTVVVYFTLHRVLKPLREASAAAAQIDARNLSTRLSTRNLPNEFLPVVTAFNLTLDRLEKGYIVQRAFLADAAHELKTPLALIRGQIEMDGTADREALLQEIDRMARQVNQLLHLAEASETQNYVFESVDVAELAEDVIDYLRRLAERHEVYVDIRRGPETPLLEADRGALFMLLKNLVENAIQHSPISGAVAVNVAANHVSVCDEGSGIAADELPKLFKRFWRGPTRRNEGAGLGLAICAEIAATHKWEITARSVGHGAQFTVFFDGGRATRPSRP
jgi:two-component system, OmpR family, sensor histidine kinase QseC